MKKRIGNDISFVWHIYRKSGDTQVPESFTGKEVEVKLISPLQRTVMIEDVSIATGVVTFTFRGKHQVTLGNYVAVLLENKGEDGMVTLDVVNAVTLVPHSYMEEDGDEGDVIEAEAVELESSISAGSGGGIEQQQVDWAQTDDTAVDYIKNKPNLDVFCRKDMANVHTSGYDRYRHEYEQIDAETTIQGDGISSCNYNKDGSLRAKTNFIPGSITLIKDGVTLNLSYRYFANLIASIQAKADGADLASLVNTGTYNSTSKKIELKHDNNVLAEIDATAFIKDGMVDSVVVSNGYIVITFNTDAGKETIRIPVTDIFDPSNYYDKDDVDGLLAEKVDKVTGKGLSTNDYTTAEKTKLGALPTNEELTQILGGKANTVDLARVATSGSYNDLSDQPTLDDLNKVEDLYALDATNSDWKTKVDKMFDDGTLTTISKTFDYCNLRIYSKNASDVEYDTNAINSLETTAEGLTFADGTHFTSYKIGEKYYVGYLTGFFINGGIIIGNIEITCTKRGTIKLYLYKCVITEDAYFKINGQPTDVEMPTTDAATILSFDVNEGDVISVSPTKKVDAFHYYTFGLVGMSFYSKYPVSRFGNDAGYLTQHQDITGKADKVSNATNGNFAALDSNGNLTDSGHKHSDYLTQHQDLSNYVQKSQTAGLLKNDGTVDTTQYLSQHQDISGKADKSEMSVVQGTGTDADKTTITLKQGTSATVLTTHQDISGKEDITNIVTPINATDATLPITTLTCEVGKYYRIGVAVDTLGVTLPAMTDLTTVRTVVICLTAGTTPAVTITAADSKDVYYQDGFEIEAGETYEINALFNGAAWIVASVKINVE